MLQGWGIEAQNGAWVPIEFGRYYVRMTKSQKIYLKIRGVLERMMAILALILLSPLFIVVSIAQKISAPEEPIFFFRSVLEKGHIAFILLNFER